MNIKCDYESQGLELNEKWLLDNGFIYLDGDMYQKHYNPPNVPTEDYFLYRLSVSPYDKVRLTDAGLELKRVHHLNFIYKLLNSVVRK